MPTFLSAMPLCPVLPSGCAMQPCCCCRICLLSACLPLLLPVQEAWADGAVHPCISNVPAARENKELLAGVPLAFVKTRCNCTVRIVSSCRGRTADDAAGRDGSAAVGTSAATNLFICYRNSATSSTPSQ